MEEEKKKKEISNTTKVIAVIMFVIFFILGFFLGRNLFNNTKEEKKEETKSKSELYNLKDGEIDLNNKELQKYLNMYKMYSEVEYDFLLNSAANGNETARLTLVTRLLNDSDIEEVECKKIKKDSISKHFEELYPDITCGETSILSDDWENSQFKTSLIKKETMEKYLKYYYGENTVIKDTNNTFTNLKGDCYSYYYQDDLDSYVKINTWCGVTAPIPIEKINRAVKQDDKIIIESTISYEDMPQDTSDVTLTLKYEESTDHYVFESRLISEK